MALFTCKKIITGCAACYSMILKDYPKMGFETDITVQHFTEFFSEIMKEKNIKLKKDVSRLITYHDPCHLGRRGGIYDAPRDILMEIMDGNFKEMQFNREKAKCCGAGGGVKFNYPDLAKSICLQRLEEAQILNVDLLVSACPLCKNHFIGVKGENIKLKIADISELIADVYLG